jgi:hypothetical protein
MFRASGQFSTVKKKKVKDILKENSFTKSSRDEVNNAGDCPRNLTNLTDFMERRTKSH